MDNISTLLEPLEACIRNEFLPALVKHQFNDQDRLLFSLPAKFGGLGIFNPTEICKTEFQNSCLATQPLVNLITEQAIEFSPDDSKKLKSSISSAKLMISNFKTAHHNQKLKEFEGNHRQRESYAHRYLVQERFIIMVNLSPPGGVWFHP